MSTEVAQVRLGKSHPPGHKHSSYRSVGLSLVEVDCEVPATCSTAVVLGQAESLLTMKRKFPESAEVSAAQTRYSAATYLVRGSGLARTERGVDGKPNAMSSK
jgi:hypothetical protein